MPWKFKEEKHTDGSQTITYDYELGGYLSSRIFIKIHISSADILDTFTLFRFDEGIKSFQRKHPGVIPEGIGYIDEKSKLFIILGILDNGAGPKSSYIDDYDLAEKLPSEVMFSMLERKQVILNILKLLTNEYEFPKKPHSALKQHIEKDFTFFGAVTMAASKIENAKIYHSVAFYPPKERLEKLRAKKLGDDAINLLSAMKKLLAFASRKQFENFTQEEIEILTTKEKFIPLLRKESSWLICLHKEFPEEMAAAAKNEPLPSKAQSYTEIQSAIGSKAEEKEEEEKEEAIKPAPAVKSKKPTRTSRKTETTPLIKPTKPEREPEEEPCISCTIL